MKLKNKVMSALVLSLAVTGATIPGVAHAGAGEWDTAGYDEGWVDGSMSLFSSQLYDSGGGDFEVECLINQTGGVLSVSLYESDNGTTSGGSHVDTKQCTESSPAVFDARGWTDGDNQKAEFYILMSTNSGTYGYVQVRYRD